MRTRAPSCWTAAAALAIACTGCSALQPSAEPATATVTVTQAPATPTPATPTPSASATTATPTATRSATLQSAFEDVRSGVVRLEVSGCDGRAIGSGFEVAPHLVVTAAHVVSGGQVVEVIQGTSATAGTVVGLDAGADVALVRTTSALDGFEFGFAADDPRVGDAIAAIGYPEGDPLTFNTGTVNAVGRKADIEGTLRHDLLEMDAATTHGSSGGPVVRADGEVVGIVDAGPDGEQGRRLAVSSATASPLVAAWTTRPSPPEATDCTALIELGGEDIPADELPTSPTQQALSTLQTYFDAVNGGDYPTAVAQTIRDESPEEFAGQVATSRDTGFSLGSVREEGDRVVVWLTFTSLQEAGQGPADRPGETCTDWSLDYVLARHAGLWLIDSSGGHGDAPDAPCADDPDGEAGDG